MGLIVLIHLIIIGIEIGVGFLITSVFFVLGLVLRGRLFELWFSFWLGEDGFELRLLLGRRRRAPTPEEAA
jgi:hypothetical protein